MKVSFGRCLLLYGTFSGDKEVESSFVYVCASSRHFAGWMRQRVLHFKTLHLIFTDIVNRFSDGFFPSTSRLWNSLLSFVFPASFNLSPFKRQVYHRLKDQTA